MRPLSAPSHTRSGSGARGRSARCSCGTRASCECGSLFSGLASVLGGVEKEGGSGSKERSLICSFCISGWCSCSASASHGMSDAVLGVGVGYTVGRSGLGSRTSGRGRRRSRRVRVLARWEADAATEAGLPAWLRAGSSALLSYTLGAAPDRGHAIGRTNWRWRI